MAVVVLCGANLVIVVLCGDVEAIVGQRVGCLGLNKYWKVWLISVEQCGAVSGGWSRAK